MVENDYPMTNEIMSKNRDNKKFDLEERTAKFGAAIISLAKKILETVVTKPIISQLIRAGTSIGANYCEADDAESKKDFRHKIGICKKEARETKYWLRMLAIAYPTVMHECKTLWQEAKELNLIFNAIFIAVKIKH